MAINEAAKAYSQVVDAYETGRPDYPTALFPALPLDKVRMAVELGAGTGKFTRSLRSCLPPLAEFIAVEPVSAMAAKLENIPGVRVLNRTASDTGLSHGSADLVICAQSFHWFDTMAAVTEIARILHPGGTLALIWNIRDTRVGWVRELDALVDHHQGDAPREKTGRWRWILSDPRFDFESETIIINPWPMSRQGVHDRVLSTSFIAKLPENERRKLATAVDAILDAHGLCNGEGCAVEMPYRTHLYVLTRRTV